MVRITLTKAASRGFEALPEVIQARVLVLLGRLERWPEVSGAHPLRAPLAGYWRLRTGAYRVLFRVEGERVIVEKVGRREGFNE